MENLQFSGRLATEANTKIPLITTGNIIPAFPVGREERGSSVNLVSNSIPSHILNHSKETNNLLQNISPETDIDIIKSSDTNSSIQTVKSQNLISTNSNISNKTHPIMYKQTYRNEGYRRQYEQNFNNNNKMPKILDDSYDSHHDNFNCYALESPPSTYHDSTSLSESSSSDGRSQQKSPVKKQNNKLTPKKHDKRFQETPTESNNYRDNEQRGRSKNRKSKNSHAIKSNDDHQKNRENLKTSNPDTLKNQVKLQLQNAFTADLKKVSFDKIGNLKNDLKKKFNNTGGGISTTKNKNKRSSGDSDYSSYSTS